MDFWHIMQPELPLAEKIVRPIVVYFFLLLAFRLAGKRELGQMTAFDLVVLLTVSNVVQNAMIGNDNSLGGGLIGAVALLSINGIVSRTAVRVPALSRFLDGSPTLLIENGKVMEHNLHMEVMTMAELERSIRKHDMDPETELPSIRRAYLEEDGSVTIIRYS